jgi:acyl-CoA thioesterase YciA
MTDGTLPPGSAEFELATRHVVMERDLNAFGHLFGGTMLAWLDEGAALYLMEKIGYRDFVTVRLDNVEFKSPGQRGDAIVILCRVLRTGRSSVQVVAKAVSQEASTGATREIITCGITYVCLKDDRPYPYFQSPEYHAWVARRARGTPAAGTAGGSAIAADAGSPPKADLTLPPELR